MHKYTMNQEDILISRKPHILPTLIIHREVTRTCYCEWKKELRRVYWYRIV